MAVAGTLAVIGFHLPWYRIYADAVTGVGEVRTVQLPDGSSATLNTNSAICVRYTKDRRAVELLSGEADFNVVADATRPFVVEAGGGSTRALGTEFAVRRSADDVSVTAVEHSIVVNYTAREGLGGHVATLRPGEHVHYSYRAGMGEVLPADTGKIRAWMHGRLIFEDEPLGNVVAELNRYHQLVIFVTDSRLNSLKINGVFRTNDPVGAVDALERSIGVHSIRVTDYVILIHG
jgi:transmembrane sensor